MKRQRKTYGIKGFMEYQAVIKVGCNRMKVQFSDGSVSAMGVNPAIFTTEQYMIQHAIENSAEFKRGLIELVRVIDLEGDVAIERCEGKRGGSVESGSEGSEGSELSEGSAAGGRTGRASLQEGGAEDGVEAYESVPDSGLIEVEFASNDEAKDYLEQNFGLVRSKLRNRDDIRRAGEANGVEIIFV